MILVLDNHDSFTFNLVQGLGTLGASVVVHESDAISISSIRALSPAAIVISPGPGKPEDAGISAEVVRGLGSHLPLLGVCLGHQVICQALGAKVEHARALVHGRTSRIRHDERGLFHDLPNPFQAARYHSLIVNEATLPDCLEPSAHSEEGELMAVRHRAWPVWGVQFHPESFLTEVGPTLLHNFLQLVAAYESVQDGIAHG